MKTIEIVRSLFNVFHLLRFEDSKRLLKESKISRAPSPLKIPGSIKEW
jgi:hypothetical protein